jgi:O-glycosyl hydrolase
MNFVSKTRAAAAGGAFMASLPTKTVTTFVGQWPRRENASI